MLVRSFSDLDPERGIKAGERWEDVFRGAADRCAAVLPPEPCNEKNVELRMSSTARGTRPAEVSAADCGVVALSEGLRVTLAPRGIGVSVPRNLGDTSGGLGCSLRVLYRLPHAARRRGHIDAVDAEWTQRINDRIDDDRWSPDGAGFADALHADRIGLAANFF